jgi:flagella basal body P-ring formation protein FlgA
MCRVTNPACPSPVNDKNEVFDSVSRRQLRQSRMKRSGLKYRVLIVNDDPFLLCGY